MNAIKELGLNFKVCIKNSRFPPDGMEIHFQPYPIESMVLNKNLLTQI